MWCFVRVFLKAPSGRHRFNVLGALDAVTLEVVTITNDSYINARSVCQLLLKLRLRYPDDSLTLVLDNARYQRCRLVSDTAAALDIELLFFPPYSPNLKECLATCYYDSFAAFKTAIQSCLADPQDRHKQMFTSLLTLNFQFFDNVTL